MEQRGGVRHKARSLSDGTLRFLALATIAYDPEATGLICLEEPENGIHPSRIDAILELLREMAVDPRIPVGPDNPLRQVIINTHSPSVVRNLVPDELLVALRVQRGRVFSTKYAPMANSWRAKAENAKAFDAPVVSLSELLDFLTNRNDEEESIVREGRLWQLAAAQSIFDFDDMATK
jgi:predicted ATPase